MKYKYATILFFLISLLIFSCKQEQELSIHDIGDDIQLQETILTLQTEPSDKNLWLPICSYLTQKRRFTELIGLVEPILDSSKLNDGLKLNLCTYMAQAYLFTENFQKARKYLDEIESRIGQNTPSRIIISYHNISAIYAMKTEMDYSKAIHHLNLALKYAKNSRNGYNYCGLLCNMASLYIDRGDTAGMKYAQEAYSISMQSKDYVSIRYSSLVMAQIAILSHNIKQAENYAATFCETLTFIKDSSYTARYNLIMGDIYFLKENFGEALQFYEKALENAKKNDPTSIIESLLKAGMTLNRLGIHDKAADLFKEGLQLSYGTDNIEYRHKLLLGLSECYDATGNKALALDYHKAYHHLTDSLSLIQKERDFHKLLMNYDKMEYESMMHKKEMAIQSSHRQTIITAFILFIVLITAVGLWFMYRSKDKSNRQLIEQYEKYKQRTDNLLKNYSLKPDPSKEKNKEKDKELYAKIDRIIMEHRLWRDKELTLDKLAEMTGSNRSYVSNAINDIAGMSFYNYLNMKRVDDAVKMLSDSCDNTPLKVIADIVGFSSQSSFSTVFQRETGLAPSKYREYSQKTS